MNDVMEHNKTNEEIIKKDSNENLDYLPGILQRKALEKNIPILLIIDGWHFSGKGYIINKILQPLDSRGYKVSSFEKLSKKDKNSPFMWPYWRELPQRGSIGIFSSSWYYRLTNHFYRNGIDDNLIKIVNDTEKLLTDDGYVLLKIFLNIDKKEQSKRIKKISKDKNISWLLNKEDIKQNKNYKKYLNLHKYILNKTDSSYSKWFIVNANNKKSAKKECLSYFLNTLKEVIPTVKKEPVKQEAKKTTESKLSHYKILDKIDYKKQISDTNYKNELPILQKRIRELQLKLLKKKIPLIIAFEGWDAAGKGGTIRRLTERMDPRNYRVNPYCAPDTHELKYNYLWRFWENFPVDGHVAIFDRTWYGRVLVERVEGFAKREEWKRAYKEINDMEYQLYYHGTIIIKFWLEIDEQTQLERFKSRENDKYKKWKITDEDWRNRSKRSLYKEALEEMLEKTDKKHSPWIIVEGNSKKFERIKVLKEVIKNIEKRL